MAITLHQLKSLGFLPAKRSSIYNRKYDTLIFPLNKTDHLYLGYNQYNKEINNKSIWKSFKHPETNERITYKVINLGETGFDEMKEFLRISVINSNVKQEWEPLEEGKMQTFTPTGIDNTTSLIPQSGLHY